MDPRIRGWKKMHLALEDLENNNRDKIIAHKSLRTIERRKKS